MVSIPPGVFQVWLESLCLRSLVTNSFNTRLPAAPLSKSALIVTGLGLPCLVLRRTKATGFQWSEQCQTAFDALKCKLVSAPILVYPEFDKPFLLYTDASDNAIGGVLGQKHVDGEKVIAYWSRQLHKAEGQYSTVEKEALAAVSAVKEFYHSLLL